MKKENLMRPWFCPGLARIGCGSLANFPQRGDLSLCGSQFDDPYRFRNFVVGSPYGIRIACTCNGQNYSFRHHAVEDISLEIPLVLEK